MGTNHSIGGGARVGLAIIVMAAVGFAARPSAAQYLEPSDDDGGYLDDSQSGAQTAPPLQPVHPEPFVTLGFAVDLGASLNDYQELDNTFFTPNDAKAFGTFGAFAIDGSGWVQIGSSFRVGVEGGSQISGTGRTFTNYGNGGLLLEGGLSVHNGWSYFGGAVLGYQGLRAETNDSRGREFAYEAEYFWARLQAHVEKLLTPGFGLRGTFWYSFTAQLNEDFYIPVVADVDAVVPVETNFGHRAAGLMFGVVFRVF
jgi:hypothetical protein